MSKVKTCELQGAALDWAVAICEYPSETQKQLFTLKNPFKYSTEWMLAGPIIEREGLYLRANDDASKWASGGLSINRHDGKPGPLYWADTPLIAAMRCYVASKLGDEVEIPEELA